MADLTQLLYQWNEGSEDSLDALISLAYQRLHRSAKRVLGDYGNQQSLQATELVNELYCHFRTLKTRQFNNSSHFFAIAYYKLRQILQEKYRRKQAQKRDSGCDESCDNWDDVALPETLFDLLVYTDVIDTIREIDADAARIVELRTFWEFSVSEIVEILQISDATYYRQWNWAKAWLRQQYKEVAPHDS